MCALYLYRRLKCRQRAGTIVFTNISRLWVLKQNLHQFVQNEQYFLSVHFEIKFNTFNLQNRPDISILCKWHIYIIFEWTNTIIIIIIIIGSKWILLMKYIFQPHLDEHIYICDSNTQYLDCWKCGQRLRAYSIPALAERGHIFIWKCCIRSYSICG